MTDAINSCQLCQNGALDAGARGFGGKDVRLCLLCSGNYQDVLDEHRCQKARALAKAHIKAAEEG